MINRRTMLGGTLAATLLALWRPGHSAEPADRLGGIESDQQSARFIAEGRPYATYVHRDKQITRPYFKDLRSIDNKTPLTRHFPPRKGIDLDDHAEFHPGLWLAFGDVSGADFWRLKARVVQEKITLPKAQQREDAIEVINRYETAQGQPLLRETCRLGMSKLESDWLLTWDSTFTALDGDITFGDQEEMGLGIRMATPLIVKNGGTIANSHGDKNEKGCWGKAASWCDYSGVVDKHRYGLVLLPHPENAAPCRFHARDYGLLVANPFAVKAFDSTRPAAKTVVKRGETLRLRFGICGYGLPDEQPIDGDAILAEYVLRA